MRFPRLSCQTLGSQKAWGVLNVLTSRLGPICITTVWTNQTTAPRLNSPIGQYPSPTRNSSRFRPTVFRDSELPHNSLDSSPDFTPQSTGGEVMLMMIVTQIPEARERPFPRCVRTEAARDPRWFARGDGLPSRQSCRHPVEMAESEGVGSWLVNSEGHARGTDDVELACSALRLLRVETPQRYIGRPSRKSSFLSSTLIPSPTVPDKQLYQHVSAEQPTLGPQC